MLYFLSDVLHEYFGPFRLLGSHTVLIGIALLAGFFVTVWLLPKFYGLLPKDRGREFTVNPNAAIGKPTGAGVVFIILFVVLSFLVIIP